MSHQPFPQRPYTPLLLAGVPRSGSNLLRLLLNNHPDILIHGEVFNIDEETRKTALLWKDRPCVAYESGTFQSHLEKHVFPEDAGNLQVVGFKLFPLHCENAPEGREEVERMVTSIPGLKVILLERSNLLDMAISGLTARRDRTWLRFSNQQALHQQQLSALPKDIMWQMECIHKEQEDIRRIVDGCDVFHVTYEDLIRRTARVTRDIQQWLGVDVRTLRPSTLLRKQRTRPRSETVQHMDALWELCAQKHPEWLGFFDEAEDLAELQLGNTEAYSVVPHSTLSFATRFNPLKNPAFYLQLFHDTSLAEHAVQRLRQSYPRARVILQSDGDDDAQNASISERLVCEYFTGERLYVLEQGGRMLQRMLNDYLSGEGEWLVKMDTDTRIDRPFRHLPNDRAIYGQPLRHGPPQGGCLIIPRAVAEELRNSRLFLSPLLRQPLESWGQRMPKNFLEERLASTGCIGFEWTLFWACQQLNIPILPHPEIHATWKQGHINAEKLFAAVHPDKFIDVDDQRVHDLCTTSHAGAHTIWLDAISRSV